MSDFKSKEELLAAATNNVISGEMEVSLKNLLEEDEWGFGQWVAETLVGKKFGPQMIDTTYKVIGFTETSIKFAISVNIRLALKDRA